MRRRRKILIRNIVVIIAIAGIIVLFYYAFFRKKANIKTSNQTSNKSGNSEFETMSAPKVEIILPEKIHDTTENTTNNHINTSNNNSNNATTQNTASSSNSNQDTNDNSDNNNQNTDTASSTSSETSSSAKIYKPLQSVEEREFPKRYLETITNTDKIIILIGDDSQEFIDRGSPIKIGVEYQVIGIEEPMLTTYIFNISNYNYPIFLLLSQSGTLYFIDTQKAYSTGEFKIDGKIENIPEVKSVHETRVEENGNSYSTAVITCQNGEGYEFSLEMIGK